jgi:hypothetical protein
VGREYSTRGRDEICIKNCSWKHEGKRPLGRSMCRWECSVRKNVKEIKWDVVDCIHRL